MPDETIRVLLVDDHPAVLWGLKAILDGFDDFEVVGQADNGAQAVRMCQQAHPHVVLMDLAMPEMDGIEATRQIRAICPEAHVLMLTSSEQDEHVSEALDAGATGYLIKNAGVQDTVNAIRAASVGKRALSPEALEALIRTKTNRAPIQEPLSEREREILQLITQGLSNPQIAGQLAISLSTVKFHIGSIFKKLDVANRAEAVTRAFKQDLVHE